MKNLKIIIPAILLLSGCSATDIIDKVDNKGNSDNATAIVSNEELANNKEISVDACDLSGEREANVKVNIGYDDREYYAYTNENSQLVYVEASEIELQDDDTEDVTSQGRYCSDEAKVPGVEADDLDEGHAIADSLGGVSNAYNITPEESTLNRHGAQADMEEQIREAEATGQEVTDFKYSIEYPDTETQIPSKYSVSFAIDGTEVTYDFENTYDGEVSSSYDDSTTADSETSENSSSDDSDVVYENCTEVKEEGAAPLHEDDPGYSSKLDRDGDGEACSL